MNMFRSANGLINFNERGIQNNFRKIIVKTVQWIVHNCTYTKIATMTNAWLHIILTQTIRMYTTFIQVNQFEQYHLLTITESNSQMTFYMYVRIHKI